MKEFVELYGLSEYDAGVLTAERSYVEYFEEVFGVCSNAKAACNWVTSELFGALKKSGTDFEKTPVSANNLGKLIKLVDTDEISGKMAKTVFEEMLATGKAPEAIIAEKGLRQITDPAQIGQVVDQIFAANPSQLAEFKGGNDRLQAFFVGQTMKATKGTANPGLVNQIIAEKIGKLRG